MRHFNHFRRSFLVRLACVKHAASVRSEPGSNSQVLILFLPIDSLLKYSPEGLRLARQAALSDKNVEELSYSKHINIKPHACLVNLVFKVCGEGGSEKVFIAEVAGFAVSGADRKLLCRYVCA